MGKIFLQTRFAGKFSNILRIDSAIREKKREREKEQRTDEKNARVEEKT